MNKVLCVFMLLITMPFYAAEKKRKNTPRKIVPASQIKKFKPTPVTPPLTPAIPAHIPDKISIPTLISQTNEEEVLRSLLTQAIVAQQQQASLRMTKLEEQREKDRKHIEKLESQITILTKKVDEQTITLQDHAYSLTSLTTTSIEHAEALTLHSEQIVDLVVSSGLGMATLSREQAQAHALKVTDPIIEFPFEE